MVWLGFLTFAPVDLVRFCEQGLDCCNELTWGEEMAKVEKCISRINSNNPQ